MTVLSNIKETLDDIATDTGLNSDDPALPTLNILRILFSKERLNKLEYMTRQTSKFRLAFVGPSGSGKTTLINTLLGTQLPIVSATRITVLRYAPLAEASIRLFKLLPGDSKECEDEPVVSLATVTNARQATKMADPYLRCPLEDGASDGMIEWMQKVVVISYPIPMLESGLEVHDIPGSKLDNLKEMRSNFFSVVRPNAAVFCYANPAFSDAEVYSYQDFVDNMQVKFGDGFNADSHLFMANTKFNVAAYKNSHHIEHINDVTDEQLINEEITIYQHLKERSVLDGWARPEQFSMVNSMDYLASKSGIHT
ncbi:hypothetical protein SAMD00019534_089300 [Acytostelium subglobosum LB1]|uniref:hypothetical protein n=1 Tax=Acytostelium subglobosum LB1 TaxID=1410327 RepID=UPI000644D538|nr:hypothetical protein SAMD00019534_089300 [Acytostelium subglobosum LB1]GAM25755.1 hypothetical protein SAMD00019534_089300 [Acytostelium subglobosum LB1]|eukprot:XP_012751273.1 hypothetical protein SAMD00019534_089300 [Acytostelium subglobosum LB1]